MDSVFQENTPSLASPAKRPLLSIIYLCDCSGSMAGSRIAAVNTAITKILPKLNALTGLYPQIDFQLGILSFANTAQWHLPPTLLSELAWSPLVDASGISSLGAAYCLLADHLKNLTEQATLAALQPLAPILLLLSDGMPTDDVMAGLRILSAQALAQQSWRFAIGIGPEVDQTVLQDWVQVWKQSKPTEQAAPAFIQLGTAESAVELRELVASFTLDTIRLLLADSSHG